jgi:tetratricopeptide (TPR) repeat protein
MQQPLNEARKLLLMERRYQEGLDALLPLWDQSSDMSFADYRAFIEMLGLAYAKLEQYDKATETFSSITDHYQAGYAQMLKGDMDQASALWRPLLIERQNHWCLMLYGMVTSSLNCLPTFLQVRNHLEADIIQLSQAGRDVMVHNLLNYVDIISDINYEAYKFAGRALYHAGRQTEAGPFLLKGQKTLPNDPEVYFHLGQYYHAIGKDEDARLMLHQCILISPNYVPARSLYSVIQGETSCSS